jgi:hypothetical protein
MPPADKVVETLHDGHVSMAAADQNQVFFHKHTSYASA